MDYNSKKTKEQTTPSPPRKEGSQIQIGTNRLVIARRRGLRVQETGKLVFFFFFNLNKLNILKYGWNFKVSGYLYATFRSNPLVLNLSANMSLLNSYYILSNMLS